MSVIFTTGQFVFKYDRFILMTCLEVEPWYLTTTVCEVLPDKMVTV